MGESLFKTTIINVRWKASGFIVAWTEHHQLLIHHRLNTKIQSIEE